MIYTKIPFTLALAIATESEPTEDEINAARFACRLHFAKIEECINSLYAHRGKVFAYEVFEPSEGEGDSDSQYAVTVAMAHECKRLRALLDHFTGGNDER
jgi:hypothetical protein